ncbi:MAG: hypothetical protein ACRC5A_15595, partial [Enterobacteriaceae bacterium]
MHSHSSLLHFYDPGKNSYFSETSLWIIAKEAINPDGVRWLETRWISHDGEAAGGGLALYTSHLDALISCRFINQYGEPLWRVYPFQDINVTEMMLNIRDQQRDEFCMALTFGFSLNACGQLVEHKQGLRTVSHGVSFPVGEALTASSPVTLKFPPGYFESINTRWQNCFDNYCALTDEQNSLPLPVLEHHAQNALQQADIVTTY